MNNQYLKIVSTSQYQTLPDEIRKIERKNWYKNNTRKLFLCYKELKKYFGKVNAKNSSTNKFVFTLQLEKVFR